MTGKKASPVTPPKPKRKPTLLEAGIPIVTGVQDQET